jgi:hypothetical protein
MGAERLGFKEGKAIRGLRGEIAGVQARGRGEQWQRIFTRAIPDDPVLMTDAASGARGGDVRLCLEQHVTRHTSHVTRHTSHVTSHTQLTRRIRLCLAAADRPFQNFHVPGWRMKGYTARNTTRRALQHGLLCAVVVAAPDRHGLQPGQTLQKVRAGRSRF